MKKYNSLESFLDQFPNDAQYWSKATDEVRDIARWAKEYYNELENQSLPSCNFIDITTPSDWNTIGKKYIFDVYNKMNDYTKSEFDNLLKENFNIYKNI